MTVAKPTTGSEALPFLTNTTMWADIVDMLNWYRGSKQKSNQIGNDLEATLLGINTTGSPFNQGRLVCLDVLQNPLPDSADIDDDDGLINELISKPIWSLKDPVWHTDIADVFLVYKTIYQDSLSALVGPRILTVNLSEIGDANDRWVMVDPANPTRMKTSDAGIYRLLTLFDRSGDTNTKDSAAVVDTTQAQPLWRCEMVDANNIDGRPIKLLRLDGTVYADETTGTTLTDPDLLFEDLTTGDKGWVLHEGNNFRAIQAPCP